MIGIVNYGMGNIASVQNALNYLGIANKVVDTPKDIFNYPKLILPGVGAFGKAMKNLNESGFSDALKEYVQIKQNPILGICLGMQLLLESSTEHGYHEGLGLIRGHVKFFGDVVKQHPVPHVGWNDLIMSGNESKLIPSSGQASERACYFVHSYYCDVSDKENVTAQTKYEIIFDTIVEKEAIFGCQFHPEKSQKSGLDILLNFSKLSC